jgi:hypothetical protein
VVYRRPASYRERRTDGYQEPALIFILGTAHVSDQSAADVSQLIQAVQPDAVVVELCKSRTGVLNTGEDEGEPQQQQQQQQKEARLQEHQARWQQQWQQWQQRKDPGGAAAAAASSSSATNSAEEEQDTSPHQTLATTDTAAVTSSSSSNSSSASQAPSGGVWQQLRSSLTASRASKASNPLSLAGADPVSALARSAALGGQQAMLLRLLIAGQARKAAGEGGGPGCLRCSSCMAVLTRFGCPWSAAISSSGFRPC